MMMMMPWIYPPIYKFNYVDQLYNVACIVMHTIAENLSMVKYTIYKCTSTGLINIPHVNQ